MTGDLQELVQQAQPDVSERRLARVYGEALLNAAEKQGAAAEVVAQMHELVADVTRRDRYVLAFFTSGVIGKDRRELVIKTAFESRCHPLVLDFLLVLNDHDRLFLFRTIVVEVQKLDDLRRRRFPVHVQSAVALADDQRERLVNDLRQTFRLEPILDQRLDPELLGGMIVRVADWVFDGSVRTQLINLRKQLREMSSHEIQSRRDRFGAAEGN
jgi:F-type H+-transporting ATPase subunit delta